MNDVGVLDDGSEVWLLKKAILSTYVIHHGVGDLDSRYSMEDIGTATGIIDNVVPAMLIKYGAMDIVDADMKERIQSRQPLPAGPKEAELRAIGNAVLEQLASATSVNSRTLSDYFWLIGKDGNNRTFERHHTQDTIYY